MPNVTVRGMRWLAGALSLALLPAGCASAQSSAGIPGATNTLTATQAGTVKLLPLKIARPNFTHPYSRVADFGTWEDLQGCKNTRAIVLIRRSLAPVTYTRPSDCTVATGKWIDPWSGIVTTKASAFQIDHTVPLANAWYAGAWSWTKAQRLAYANDITDLDHLVPITAHENDVKDANGPDKWKPPSKGAWCTYALVWDHIKAKWKLTATTTEWAAVVAMAKTCK